MLTPTRMDVCNGSNLLLHRQPKATSNSKYLTFEENPVFSLNAITFTQNLVPNHGRIGHFLLLLSVRAENLFYYRTNINHPYYFND